MEDYLISKGCDPVLSKLVARTLRTTVPSLIAQELIGVQPMDSKPFNQLYELARSKEQLTQDGYEPVSELGLMYIKKEEPNETN